MWNEGFLGVGGEIIVLEFRFVGQKPHFWCAQNAKTCTYHFAKKKHSVTQTTNPILFSQSQYKMPKEENIFDYKATIIVPKVFLSLW